MKFNLDLYKCVTARFSSKAHIAAPSFEAKLLIEEANDQVQLEKFIKQRLNGEPVAYIIGSRDFWKHRFNVNQHTLIPRPDSETLVEQALNYFQDNELSLKVLDLGTGSGCLLLSVLSEFKNARGVGVDVSAKALEVAKRNAKQLSLEEKVIFVESHWFSRLKGKFDIILANPPYIDSLEKAHMAKETLEHEPHLALFTENNGLQDYDDIAREIHRYLTPTGYAFVELNPFSVNDIKKLFLRNSALEFVSVANDLGGRPRCLTLKKQN